MNITQKIAISPLLAQKKLSGNGNNSGGSNATVSDDYSFNPSIKELPSFNTPDNSEQDNEGYGLPIAYIVATLARKAKRAYERHLARERGEELLLKAKEYEIPYDVNAIDIITLRDKVEEFEGAIELANEYGIDWKNFGYDILGIEQEVAEVQEAENNYLSIASGYYWSDRVVGA